MLPVAAAALAWIALHLGIAGTRARAALTRTLGETGFRAGFSLLSIIVLTLLVLAWRGAPLVTLWVAPRWLHWLVVLLMLPAFILFMGSITLRNPTAIGGGGAKARGMIRVTRHPMLWAFLIWALLHIAAQGTLGAAIFFGAFAVTAGFGMPSIDAKLAARDPSGFARLRDVTAILPFAAIAAGRNRLLPGELVLPLVLGLVAWAAMLWLHPVLFGLSPLPR